MKQFKREKYNYKKIQLLKKRNVIERMFGALKTYKRLLLRWETKEHSYMQFWYFGCIEVLFKKLNLPC